MNIGSCVDPNPLRVERQDPDNFPRLQTRKRCALEIAAYVFKHCLWRNKTYVEGTHYEAIQCVLTTYVTENMETKFKELRALKGLIWPPLEPETEICFHQFLLIGCLEE